MANNNTDLSLNNNSYVSFDATSISDLIISRLNQNNVFTDQVYQGSNLSSLIDVISYTFSTLLYYLNKTSSESMFSEAQIYENMNRIVKILNYNPKGKITQSVSFNLQASLPINTYIIPRYSYISVGPTKFSFAKDIYFSIFQNGILQIQNSEIDYFLYEGVFKEYPLYTALGATNEIVYLNLGENTYMDHNNIDVYVKYANTNNWVQWKRSENLFLNKSNDEVFEVRYNPNKNYEIKFGDNINGKQLNTGDSVLVYYMQIDPNVSTIAANTINKKGIVFYNSLYYNQIQNDTIAYPGIIINQNNVSNVNVTNPYSSNAYIPEESVEDIRKNAPKSFSYQGRLVTSEDFKSFIVQNYKNFISDVHVVNNDDYLKGHMKYLYNIGLKSPQLDNTVLYNHVNFSNSCNFNNVYAYILPTNGDQTYLTVGQKEIILNDINNSKTLTTEVIPIDPVYMLFDFYTTSGLKNPNPSVDDLSNCYLYVYKTPNARQSDSGILNEVVNLISKYFSKTNLKFNQTINLTQLNSDILNLNGVQKIQTFRTDTNSFVDGLSFLVWNSTYPKLDANVYNYNFTLEYFQYPLFNNISNLINRIKIVDSVGFIKITDY